MNDYDYLKQERDELHDILEATGKTVDRLRAENEELKASKEQLKKALIKRNIKLSEQAIIHAESEG